MSTTWSTDKLSEEYGQDFAQGKHPNMLGGTEGTWVLIPILLLMNDVSWGGHSSLGLFCQMEGDGGRHTLKSLNDLLQ